MNAEKVLNFEPYTINEKTLAINGLLITLNKLNDKPLKAAERVYGLAQASNNNSKLILTHHQLEFDGTPDSIRYADFFLNDLAQYISIVCLPKQKFVMPAVSTLPPKIELIKCHIQNNYNDQEIIDFSNQLIKNSQSRSKFWTKELDQSKHHLLIKKIKNQRFQHD